MKDKDDLIKDLYDILIKNGYECSIINEAVLFSNGIKIYINDIDYIIYIMFDMYCLYKKGFIDKGFYNINDLLNYLKKLKK